MDTGPRYKFGAISIDQTVIRADLVKRFLRFHEGDPYNSTQLLRTQFALDDSLYFATVEVTPGDPDPGNPDRAGQHHRHQEQARVHHRRRLRHGHFGARHAGLDRHARQ